MIRARLSRLSTGHILATFKDGDTVVNTRVVGAPSDSFDVAADHVAQNFGADQIGIKSSDINDQCVADHGHTMWLPTKGG